MVGRFTCRSDCLISAIDLRCQSHRQNLRRWRVNSAGRGQRTPFSLSEAQCLFEYTETWPCPDITSILMRDRQTVSLRPDGNEVPKTARTWNQEPDLLRPSRAIYFTFVSRCMFVRQNPFIVPALIFHRRDFGCAPFINIMLLSTGQVCKCVYIAWALRWNLQLITSNTMSRRPPELNSNCLFLSFSLVFSAGGFIKVHLLHPKPLTAPILWTVFEKSLVCLGNDMAASNAVWLGETNFPSGKVREQTSSSFPWRHTGFLEATIQPRIIHLALV